MNSRLTGSHMRALLQQTATRNATGQLLLHPARAVEAASARLQAREGLWRNAQRRA